MNWKKSICIELYRTKDVLQKVSHKNRNILFQNSVVKMACTELLNKYVLVPADKASGNAAIVCQMFYVLKSTKKFDWKKIQAIILTATMKPATIFFKIYLLISNVRIFLMISIFL